MSFDSIFDPQRRNYTILFESGDSTKEKEDFDGFPTNLVIEKMNAEQLETAFSELKKTALKPNDFLAKAAVVGLRQNSWEGHQLLMDAVVLYAIELGINPQELKTARQKELAKLNLLSEIGPKALKYLDSEKLESNFILQLGNSFENWVFSFPKKPIEKKDGRQLETTSNKVKDTVGAGFRQNSNEMQSNLSHTGLTLGETRRT